MDNEENLSRPARAGRILVAVATACLSVMVTGSSSQAHRLKQQPTQRDHIVARARSMIGTPYRSAGASPSGFDCSGFTMWVFGDHGADLPHSAAAQYQIGDSEGGRRIYKMKNLEPGDLVFHDTTDAHVGHVGIYIGNDNFISATSSSGIQVRSLYDPYYWGSRYVGAVRLKATMATSPPKPVNPSKDPGPPEGRERTRPRPGERPEQEEPRGESEKEESREQEGPDSMESEQRQIALDLVGRYVTFVLVPFGTFVA